MTSEERTTSNRPDVDREQHPSGLLRVLIVDEDADSRVAIRRSIQRADFEVAGECGYGTEAVSLALEERPDAIFVAVEEPAARPLETADGLANAMPDTPILIYSSAEDAESVRRGMIFGARDYLIKPVDSSRVRDALSTAFSQEERRQMRRAGQLSSLHGRGTVVTVAGAKGGIGKSVIAVNLAIALKRESGRTVAILDADTQFGDVATMLDLIPEVTVENLTKHVSELGRENLRRYVTRHQETGVDVVAASESEDAWTSITLDDVKRIIDELAQLYDFVVVDTSGAFDAFVRTCIEASTLTLVVSTGDVSSVRDTVAASRRIERWGIPGDQIRYVLNAGAHPHGIGADRFADALGQEVFWVVPHDPSVIESVQVGQPVIVHQSGSTAADSMINLARRIGGQSSNSNGLAGGKKEPFWRRMLPLKGTADDDSGMGSVEPITDQR